MTSGCRQEAAGSRSLTCFFVGWSTSCAGYHRLSLSDWGVVDVCGPMMSHAFIEELQVARGSCMFCKSHSGKTPEKYLHSYGPRCLKDRGSQPTHCDGVVRKLFIPIGCGKFQWALWIWFSKTEQRQYLGLKFHLSGNNNNNNNNRVTGPPLSLPFFAHEVLNLSMNLSARLVACPCCVHNALLHRIQASPSLQTKSIQVLEVAQHLA